MNKHIKIIGPNGEHALVDANSFARVWGPRGWLLASGVPAAALVEPEVITAAPEPVRGTPSRAARRLARTPFDETPQTHLGQQEPRDGAADSAETNRES